MDSKSIIKSKTAWVNAVMFISSFVPVVQEWLGANPVPVLAVFAAVNVLVRFATSGRVTFFSDGNGQSAGGFGGISPVWVIGMAAAVSMAGFGLSSCSSGSLGDYGVSGSIYYKDPNSGAKAGINFDDGPTGFVKLPVYDEQTGEVIGVADVEFGPEESAKSEVPSSK